jgi:threonine synthase
LFHLECIGCHEKFGGEKVIYVCERCGDLLDVKYDYLELESKLRSKEWEKQPLSVWKYKDFLPILDLSKVVSLGEGGTRLYECSRLGRRLGVKKLYVKNEGDNPTGSFKDRGMTVGVTKALEYGRKAVLCASTGNTSASLAAYAAKAGLRCVVVVPSKKIARGKLVQAVAYGAQLIPVKGGFDDALKIVLKLSQARKDLYLLNSINPYRIEGQKTLAYEIADGLRGRPPDKVFIPVGNAGNISALWKGFKEYRRLNLIDSLPQTIGIQAVGAAPIAEAVKSGSETVKPKSHPETVATAIRIGSPVSWKKALQAIWESRGTAETVTDGEIMEAQRMLASQEGLFVEPASASTIAGLKKLVEEGVVGRDEEVVCIATGHGLKDPDTPLKFSEKAEEVEAEVEAVEKAIGVLR